MPVHKSNYQSILTVLSLQKRCSPVCLVAGRGDRRQGGCFASDTVHGVLGTARSELEARGEFELKGIDAPWQLYEVPWVDAADTGVLAARESTPYVGRARERSRLVQAVERARDGAGSLVLISGEAGVGKSRLVAETSEEAQRLGLRVLTGACVDQQGAPPYLPTIEHIEEAARSVTPDVMRQALGENAPEIAKLMPELRVRYPDIPDPVLLPPSRSAATCCTGSRSSSSAPRAIRRWC